MSPFWVYVILKLNAVVACFGVIGSVLVAVSLGVAFVAWMDATDYGLSDTVRLKALSAIKRVAVPLACAGLLCIAIAVATPTTKQAATIWLLPRIATEENIDAATDEVREVYGLAKQWLRDQVETPKAEKEEAQP